MNTKHSLFNQPPPPEPKPHLSSREYDPISSKLENINERFRLAELIDYSQGYERRQTEVMAEKAS